MQPVKLIVPGEYWDCQIYRGRLYLWNMDGTLEVYDWEQIIDDLCQISENKLALTCAFTRSDYLYDANFSVMFKDPDIVALLQAKFERIAASDWPLSHDQLARYQMGKQPNPFGELPTDTEMYSNVLYATTDRGIWAATAHRESERYRVSSRPKKLWDCPVFSIRASGSRLALAAGDEGLWGYPLANNWNPLCEELALIDHSHSSFANFSFSSIYSSSYVAQGYMVAYEWESHEGSDDRHRVLKGVFRQHEIFGEDGPGLTWGTQEKLYRATPGALQVVRYEQKKVDQGEAFQPLSSIPFESRSGAVVGGGIAPFGVVVECENGLEVLPSEGPLIHLPGTPVRWRVYPRSIRYENHLHVIYDDRLEIYSFNHDYFVDQDAKLAGFAFRTLKPRQENRWL